MKRITLLVILGFTIVLMTFSAYVMVDRLRMPYNENGVYFDEETVSTYDSQAVIFYVGLTATLFIVAVIALIKLFKTQDRQRD